MDLLETLNDFQKTPDKVKDTLEKFKKEIKIKGFHYDDSVILENEGISFCRNGKEYECGDDYIDIYYLKVVGHDKFDVVITFTVDGTAVETFIIEEEDCTPKNISEVIKNKIKLGEYYG